jgi:hypothetical protein
MSGSFKVGTFNKSTAAATASQAVTGVGFTPKALILYCTAETAEGFAANLAMSIGMTSGATQSSSTSSWSQDNVATTAAGSEVRPKVLTITVASTGAAVAECDLTSFDSDGFTLSWTTNNASAYKIHYIAFGGSDITNAKVAALTGQAGTGNKAFTGVGFQPNIIFLLINRFGSTNASSASMEVALGVGISATKRWAIALQGVSGVSMTTTMLVKTYQRTDSIFLSLTPAGVEQDRFDLVSLDADGFTLNQIVNGVTLGFQALCIKGGSWDVGSFVKSTTAAPVDQSVSGLAFAPNGYMLLGGKNVTASTSVVANANMVIGGADGTNTVTAWCEWLDATLNTSADSSIVSTKVFRNAAGPTTVKSEADHKTLDSGGFTITWSTNDTVNNPTILWVAAKLAGAAIQTPRQSGTIGHPFMF